MRQHLILVAAGALLASCGGEPEESEAVSPATQTPAPAETPTSETTANEDAAPAETAAAAEPAKLAQCKTCHTFEQDGPDRVGPNLWDVHGKPAASKPGFAYSSALRDAGITWDDATLDAYLENPRKSVPGGKMAYAGMRNADDRAEVVRYLAEQGGGAE